MDTLTEQYEAYQSANMAMIQAANSRSMAERKLVKELIERGMVDCFQIRWGRLRRMMDSNGKTRHTA